MRRIFWGEKKKRIPKRSPSVFAADGFYERDMTRAACISEFYQPVYPRRGRRIFTVRRLHFLKTPRLK